MNSELARQIAIHRHRGVLVDTNLLLLAVVGQVDTALIKKCKRTAMFQADDFHRLESILGCFNRILTTAHVLTEVSNFLGQLEGDRKSRVFKEFASRIQVVHEQKIPSRDLVSHKHFASFR